jgi:translation elongation factor EF-Ts
VTVPEGAGAVSVCPKIGVITMNVKGNASDAAQKEMSDFADKLSRQVVAMSPKFLNDAEKAAAGPKPEGEDNWETLYEQEYMSGGGGKQTSSIIKTHQKQVKHAHQVEFDISGFMRWEVGEGVERKQENYGEEVAKLVNGSR